MIIKTIREVNIIASITKASLFWKKCKSPIFFSPSYSLLNNSLRCLDLFILTAIPTVKINAVQNKAPAMYIGILAQLQMVSAIDIRKIESDNAANATI